ncbi:Zona occludens toxin [BD1-7 clade bacterium]|uniref:Zona occludens toxin n=1 Tax=BD1-7 clade bacterium TaxID=2029982 RepID=A0A5S9PAC8_9GAMM|nr:Zona occludens toxin [BD1-7 clade bacterium]CAA0101607.1 Zona occludens toxin [BD1-7 clade bacterium]
MPISAYVGLPRSGKSYSVVEHVILPALKSGREVLSNIPMNDDVVFEEFGVLPTYFETQQALDNPSFFDDVPHGAIVILDEAWRLWPSGIKANNARDGDKAFLAEHGHRSANGHVIEVILVTQDLTQIASFARNLIETTYRTVKLSAVGQDNRFRVDIYQGAVSGPNPPKRLRSDQRFGSYQESVYKYYVSQTQGDGQHSSEAKSDKRSNILTAAWLKWGIVLMVSLSILSFFGLKQVYQGYANAGQSKGAEESTSSGIPVVNPVVISDKSIVRPKPSKPDYLEGREIEITWNMGRYPDIDYRFRVSKGSSYFELSESDIQRLGYSLSAINQCLVVIKRELSSHLATCHASDKSDSLVNFDWGVSSEEG